MGLKKKKELSGEKRSDPKRPKKTKTEETIEEKEVGWGKGQSGEDNKGYIDFLGRLHEYYNKDIEGLELFEAVKVMEEKVKLHEKEVKDGVRWKYVVTYLNRKLGEGENRLLDRKVIREALKRMARLFCHASQNRDKSRVAWLYGNIRFGLTKMLSKIAVDTEENIRNQYAIEQLEKDFNDYFNIIEYEPYYEYRRGKWMRINRTSNNPRCVYFLEKINAAEESMGLPKSWVEDDEFFNVPNPHRVKGDVKKVLVDIHTSMKPIYSFHTSCSMVICG